ncbi:MAG: hypothetical protein SV760_03735, partial [Halobacteria archaeon]|nr:hypothetical protein [Halobacteria archaeon]
MRKNDAQAIVVAGFVIAIGIVTMVVILNGIIFSVSLEELGTQDDGTMTVNFHNTMVRESRQAIEVVNNVSAIQTLNNSQVNQTYVNYVE